MALGLGEIGFQHFASIARTAAKIGAKLDEAALVRKAREESVFKFQRTCMHAEHAANQTGFVDEEKQGTEARSLDMFTAEDGSVLVKAILDKVGGAALKSALEPLARRAGKDDDRSREQRLADALIDLAMHALDNGAPGNRPHLQVTTSLETLLGLDGTPAGEMEFALPISAEAVKRLACDCNLTRILLGSDSTDRRRSGQASHLGAATEGAAGARPGLRVAWVRAAGELYFRPPFGALDSRRANGPIEPGPALLPAPLDGSRGQMADRAQR
jgi:uncharacterized protein DUF222